MSFVRLPATVLNDRFLLENELYFYWIEIWNFLKFSSNKYVLACLMWIKQSYFLYIYIYLKEINFVYMNVFMVSKAGSLLFSSPGCLIRQNHLLPFWISFFLSVFLVLWSHLFYLRWLHVWPFIFRAKIYFLNLFLVLSLGEQGECSYNNWFLMNACFIMPLFFYYFNAGSN